MMGAEPLEVPHQSSATTDHQHQQTSHITPSTLVDEGCWDSSSSQKLSQSGNSSQHHLLNGGSQQGSGSTSAAKGARRTRHRVDAGEPRGCFNSANNASFGFQPRNIFTSPLNQGKGGNAGSSVSPLVASNANSPSANPLSPFHIHHHPNPHFLHHHPQPSFFPGGAFKGHPHPLPQENPQDSYYFQPMKMLSEYISSQQAVAAAAAAAMSNNSPPGQNGQVPVPSHHQLLLREMLSKSSAARNNNNNNNNNNVTKCGYEEDVVSVMEQQGQSENNRPEVEKEEDSSDLRSGRVRGSDGNDYPDSEDETRGDKGKFMESVAKTVNGHNNNSVEVGSGSASSSVTSGNSATGGGMRINGCKKRKLYQPQQRSDFEEVEEEEELDDEEYDANVLAETAFGRSKRLKESTASPRPGSSGGSPVPPSTDPQEEDEEEEMQRMMMKNEYEDDQFEDDEELPNSNRTTPNVIGKEGSANAPLTRQLLTERNSAGKDQDKAGISILRSSASPKIGANSGMNQLNNMRRRDPDLVDLPFGAGIGPNPAAFFYQWKENFKSTLITHINELVDTQFSLLFPGQGGGVKGASQGNVAPPPPHHRESPRAEKEKVPLQPKNPASLLLNGGTVCSNNNPRERELMSPPPEKMARMDRNSNFPPRFPFQMAGNVPRDRENGMNNNNNNASKLGMGHLQPHQQPHFSSALMGLNAQMQHQQALASAAVAAGLGSDMFENDAPISLVVNRDPMTPRKRRHKVTDTRLTPRAVSRLLGQVDSYGGDLSPQRGEGRTPPPMSTPNGRDSMPSLPTSVAIPNPSLSDSARLFGPYGHPIFGHHPPSGNHRLGASPPMGIHPALLANSAEFMQQRWAELNEHRNGELKEREREGRSEHVRAVRDTGSLLSMSDRGGNGARPGSAGSDSGETNSFAGDLPGSIYSVGASHSSSSTLTPMHLRKAKLMFFWVRYPSSSVIKMYFPDIKFNKNNTAQLVKWFSNFREFYYIQMEKYARQALSEGIQNAEELHVTVENELYRVLNLHYNRNNHIEVPSNFRYVVEQTLREFFKAIQQGKDQEQSWKKAIYKIIARLDDPVPEYFKSPNFLEQLE